MLVYNPINTQLISSLHGGIFINGIIGAEFGFYEALGQKKPG
jgi:hypothetical protein